jgi:hypothetical protein
MLVTNYVFSGLEAFVYGDQKERKLIETAVTYTGMLPRPLPGGAGETKKTLNQDSRSTAHELYQTSPEY